MSAPWLSSSFEYKVNLDAYFSRIEYTGSKDINAETLKKLQLQHFITIPYEILDIHLSGKVILNPEVVEDKIVNKGRGGFCYESNLLFMYALQTIGYDVTAVSARTRWQKQEDQMSPLTHLVLLVNVQDRTWLCDVGFSVCTSPVPLLLDIEEEQQTPLEKHRILKRSDYYVHQMYSLDAWHDCFFFTRERSYPMDWEVGGFYMSTYPTSPLIQMLLFAIGTTTSRRRLYNKQLTTRYVDGTVETRLIETEEEYMDVLRTIFKITVPANVRICPPGMQW